MFTFDCSAISMAFIINIIDTYYQIIKIKTHWSTLWAFPVVLISALCRASHQCCRGFGIQFVWWAAVVDVSPSPSNLTNEVYTLISLDCVAFPFDTVSEATSAELCCMWMLSAERGRFSPGWIYNNLATLFSPLTSCLTPCYSPGLFALWCIVNFMMGSNTLHSFSQCCSLTLGLKNRTRKALGLRKKDKDTDTT